MFLGGSTTFSLIWHLTALFFFCFLIMSFIRKKPFKLWQESDVQAWLTNEGFSQEVKTMFVEHNIDGEVLPHLNDDLLIEMGIQEIAVRDKILNAIKFEVSKNALKETRKTITKTGTSNPSSPRVISKDEGKNNNTEYRSGGLVSLYSDNTTTEGMDELYAYADRFGFIDDNQGNAADGNPGPEKDDPADRKRHDERENERSLKWAKFFSGADQNYSDLRTDPKFRKRIYKGIPNVWRLKVWLVMTLGTSDELDQKQIAQYQAMLEKPTSEVDENQIDLDINRTLRNHILYRQRYGPGQQRLFNVLRAYANYNPEVGFCQGMASVAAFLLIYCKEETSFWILDKLVTHDTYRLKGIWAAGFPMLMEGFFIHERMLKYHVPKLAKHFRAHNIHPSAYATRWYMTIFLGFPFHTCLRIWDVFLLSGFDILFFVAIAVLEMFQAELLGLDFEGIMEFLGQMSKQDIDDDKLVRSVIRLLRTTTHNMPGREKALNNLRREYQNSLQSGSPSLQVEL